MRESATSENVLRIRGKEELIVEKFLHQASYPKVMALFKNYFEEEIMTDLKLEQNSIGLPVGIDYVPGPSHDVWFFRYRLSD